MSQVTISIQKVGVSGGSASEQTWLKASTDEWIHFSPFHPLVSIIFARLEATLIISRVCSMTEKKILKDFYMFLRKAVDTMHRRKGVVWLCMSWANTLRMWWQVVSNKDNQLNFFSNFLHSFLFQQKKVVAKGREKLRVGGRRINEREKVNMKNVCESNTYFVTSHSFLLLYFGGKRRIFVLCHVLKMLYDRTNDSSILHSNPPPTWSRGEKKEWGMSEERGNGKGVRIEYLDVER